MLLPNFGLASSLSSTTSSTISRTLPPILPIKCQIIYYPLIMGHYGIVYIARNDQHPPNVYKIGGSSRDVDERMRELSNETATYGTFEAKAYFPVTDWEAAEASCHYELDEYRDGKEFFKAPYNELMEAVRSVCEEYQPEAHADKPTDGMSKALFLEPSPPARPDPIPEQIFETDNEPWYRGKFTFFL